MSREDPGYSYSGQNQSYTEDPRLTALYNAPVPANISAEMHDPYYAQNSAEMADVNKYYETVSEQANAIENPDSTFDKLMGDVALAGSVASLGAVGGAVIAPALSTAVGGGIGGSIVGGAGAGVVTGAGDAALTGQNIGKGALVGGLVGGIGGGLKPIVAGATGLTGATGNAVNSAITSAGTGAVRGALDGQGAASGAAGGALNSAEGAVSGSIFSAGSSIFNSGDADVPANPGLANPEAPPSISLSGNPMSADDPFSFLSQTNDGSATPGDGTVLSNNSGTPSNFGFDPTQLGNVDTGTLNPGALTGSGTDPLNFASGGAGGGSNSLLSSLLSALGAGGGSGPLSGMSTSALSQLLGLGSTIAGGALNSDAAKGAASTYAGETAFNPLATSTNAGTTNGGVATLSPQQQMLSQMLGGLANSNGTALAAGPGAAETADFNNRQSQDLQAQQRLLGNTQDNEFANGVLSSTAGGYQTEGALNAIGQQTNANQTAAIGDATTQQQQQLAQLTASLTGNQNINNAQLNQVQTGLAGGTAASNANLNAYQPSLYANSNSTFGNALTSLGNSVNNNPNPTGP